MTMVQDPDLAKYDSVPRSAIATGIVDYILPAEKMPEQLLKYVKHIPIPLQKDHPEEHLIGVTSFFRDPEAFEMLKANFLTHVWYLMRMRPYRTMENVIDGLVLTFVDIHEQKVEMGKTHELKQSLQESRQYSQAIIDTMHEALVALDKNFKDASQCRKNRC
jgi:hypothetical protein